MSALGSRLSALSQPLLSAGCVVTVRGADAVEVATNATVYTLAGGAAQALARAASELRGVATIANLSSAHACAPEALCAVLQPLADDGLVLDAAALAAARTGSALLERWRHECAFWSRRVVDRPLWRELLSARASRRLVLGWAIEFTHFVEAANEYMPLGIAHTREGARARERLSRHYVEEADHAGFFLDGLARCGIAPTAVRAAPPLASTRALINFLAEHALAGNLSYPACFGVMQAANTTATPADVHAFYDHLTASYPELSGLFDGIRRHALLDVSLGHAATVFEQLVDPDRAISPREAAMVTEAVRETAEHFALFFDGVVHAYAAPHGALPRRPFRSAAFTRAVRS